jgi:hypothetical protein
MQGIGNVDVDRDNFTIPVPYDGIFLPNTIGAGNAVKRFFITYARGKAGNDRVIEEILTTKSKNPDKLLLFRSFF